MERNRPASDGVRAFDPAQCMPLLEELLRGTESIEIADESEKPATVNAVYPVSGYSVVRAIFN